MDEKHSYYSVEVEEITKRFDNFTAVDRISFHVSPGEVFGFLGPNGSGKSTTIRMLCGIIEPDSGTGRVAGFDIKTERQKIRSRIGYMSQKFSLYEDLTVEENIYFYGGIYGLNGTRMSERKEWVLKNSGLADMKKTITGILPTGWKQRLSLGCAILHEPSILFLDEPTSGVDPVSRRKFWDMIYSLSDRGVTVFVTTHYMDEAEYCGRLALIFRGRIIAEGTSANLKKDQMKGHVLEVQCENPQAVMGEINVLDGIGEVSLFGKGLHVVVMDTENGINILENYFSKKKDKSTECGASIRRVLPSLEDVFVSLIKSHEDISSLKDIAR